jgi:hypothetical protein
MKFGVREICDVVLKAKATTVIGNKKFYANEPVIYFDTLKTSSMEGAATTVYAQGGRGNSRLVAWEGERTVTFTMEDALISPEGFMILSGAGLVEASNDKPIYQHMTETIDVQEINIKNNIMMIPTSGKPYLPEDDKVAGNYAYVMFIKDGEIVSEPYIPVHGDEVTDGLTGNFLCLAKVHDNYSVLGQGDGAPEYKMDNKFFNEQGVIAGSFDSVLIDYYVEHKNAGVQQIEITADKFGGNYYLEASTLFRDQRGVDMPAEFIIPNCKIQSNFTFTMASSGDPSTFTFTMDAFPDYTRFDRSKKVLAAIQIIRADEAAEDYRKATDHLFV